LGPALIPLYSLPNPLLGLLGRWGIFTLFFSSNSKNYLVGNLTQIEILIQVGTFTQVGTLTQVRTLVQVPKAIIFFISTICFYISIMIMMMMISSIFDISSFLFLNLGLPGTVKRGNPFCQRI